MSQTEQERNKGLVLQAFDTLFNRRDHTAADPSAGSRKLVIPCRLSRPLQPRTEFALLADVVYSSDSGFPSRGHPSVGIPDFSPLRPESAQF